MFKNYSKIAWRNLKRQPFFTFLNIFGLAIGIAGGLLISLYLYDELSFDKMFSDADRIYRIDVDVKFGGEANQFAQVSAPMAEALKNDFSQVEETVRFRNGGSYLLKSDQHASNVKEPHVAYADPSFLNMFGIALLYGEQTTALTDPNTVVLTKSAVAKHYTPAEAVGKTLVLDNDETFTIAGVIEDLPANSFLRNHTVFLAMAGYADANDNEWTSHNYNTFIKTAPGVQIDDFQKPLQSMVGTYVIPFAQKYFPGITAEELKKSGNYINYSTIALTDIHLKSDRAGQLSASSSMQNVYIMSAIALFLLVLACVNFMNLSTAHSLKRAKEVGIRKTLGSEKSALVRQFLTEAGILSSIALVLAVLLSFLALPLFNQLAGKNIHMPFSSPSFWLILVGATMVLGLLAGSYPAFFMSRFKVASVIKGTSATKLGGGKIRNVLVVFQFVISIFLIISTLVVYKQLQFIQHKDLGFEKDQVLIIEDTYALGNRVHTLKEAVQQLPQVKSASLSGYLPVPSSRNSTTFYLEGYDSQEYNINMQHWQVDWDYLETLDMELLAGRNFDKTYGTDSTAIILNESALAILGLEPQEAIGKRITNDIGSEDPNFLTVIGVLKNFNFESLRKEISALSLRIGESTGALAVKLPEGEVGAVLSKIETIWEERAAGQPFSYRFMDEVFNTTYDADQRLGRIFMTFAILSILIACLGLFGLAAFNAEKRTKEIGVRKVLGASVGQVTFRLSKDFMKLVAIAIVISLPLGWYAMQRWLEDFSYRTDLSWWVFGVAALLAISISILTVSYQSIRAALMNPTKSLRSE